MKLKLLSGIAALVLAVPPFIQQSATVGRSQVHLFPMGGHQYLLAEQYQRFTHDSSSGQFGYGFGAAAVSLIHHAGCTNVSHFPAVKVEAESILIPEGTIRQKCTPILTNGFGVLLSCETSN